MLRPPRACSTFGVADLIRVPCPAARTTTAAIPPSGAAPGGSGSDTDLLGLDVDVCWGTRTRTETSRLQRPAGCRLPHPPSRAARAPDRCPPTAYASAPRGTDPRARREGVP